MTIARNKGKIMAMHTRIKVECTCGHVGYIKCKENDQPYSKCYESYTLENLEGQSYSVDGFANMEQVIEKMKPVCPKCKTELKQSNLKTTQR